MDMKKEVPKTKLAAFLLASVLLISFTFYFYQVFFTPNILVGKSDRLIVIRNDATFKGIQKQMADEGVVNDMVSFSFVARLMGYDKQIKPGRYLLRADMSNREAVRALKMGRREAVKIVFTHVRLFDDLAEKITAKIGMTANEFKDAVNRFVDSNQQGFTKDNILAMFIPNTYEVYFNITPEELVSKMNKEYTQFWNAERLAKAEKIGLTPIEVSILASIVQAESAKGEEAPIIAGLYLNRLKRGIPLQADPTLIFALGDFTIKRVLNTHKEIDSPYNTYKYAGLPPGPVNMPYINTLEAVINAQDHKFIYMCAKEDFSGYHRFAETLSEHQVNARKYQKALTEEIRKSKTQE